MQPESHPLDYDWRYTAETVVSLCEYLPSTDPVLAIGAPSVARHLEALNRDVTLIDRQPFQGASKQLQLEAGELVDLPKHTAAIVDPPWYEADLFLWTAWAANLVGTDQTIIVSLWPHGTRPNDAAEFDRISSWLATWATVELLPFVPRYRRPPFEFAARRVSKNDFLASSPGEGRLLKLKVIRLPSLPRNDGATFRWVRFVADNYQLALKLNKSLIDLSRVHKHPNAEGWVWPYVSRRAPGREKIDLWSSHNEVALVENPNKLAIVLGRAFRTVDAPAFEAALVEYPELLGWDIPRPPYWRRSIWHHPQ